MQALFLVFFIPCVLLVVEIIPFLLNGKRLYSTGDYQVPNLMSPKLSIIYFYRVFCIAVWTKAGFYYTFIYKYLQDRKIIQKQLKNV
jgi:hypothetical protein